MKKTVVMLFFVLTTIGYASESISASWELGDFHQDWAQGVAFDGNDVWWLSGDNHSAGLNKINFGTGQIITTFDMLSTCNDPQGLTLDGSGNLMFVCYTDDMVYKLSSSNGTILGSWRTGGSKPIGITYIPEDNKFVIADENGRLYVHNANGTLAGNIVAPWGYESRNIHYKNENNVGYLYVTSFFGMAIEKYQYPSLSFTASFDAPSPWLKGICMDGTYIYVSDYNGAILRKPINELGSGCRNSVVVVPLW